MKQGSHVMHSVSAALLVRLPTVSSMSSGCLSFKVFHLFCIERLRPRSPHQPNPLPPETWPTKGGRGWWWQSPPSKFAFEIHFAASRSCCLSCCIAAGPHTCTSTPFAFVMQSDTARYRVGENKTLDSNKCQNQKCPDGYWTHFAFWWLNVTTNSWHCCW